MENKCTMVMTNREEEIELELGLSIGGGSSNSFKKAEKLIPIKKESFDTDLGENQNQNHKSFGFVDPLMKREMQALRRQEAKKKREEKQQKKGILCRANKHANADTEPPPSRECKRNRREDIKNVNLNLSIEENMNQNVGSNSNPVMCPVIPVQYPYPYPYPYPKPYAMMPSWATGGGAEKNVVQPGRSFRPGQTNGYESEQNGSADGGNRKTTSNGSPICSSSVVSDNRTSSHEVGGSSDTKSNSSDHSLPEQHQLNGSHEHSASSHLMEISQITDETTNCVENMAPSDIVQSSPTIPKEEAVSDTQPISTEKSVSNRPLSPLEETKGGMSKPPKPEIQNHNTPSLPHMPCVSTTGNGPNGKTINGLLYRYTKTEVSIVCVCHGTLFSPAEFVQHAGGTDVTNPLRDITVIPSAF